MTFKGYFIRAVLATRSPASPAPAESTSASRSQGGRRRRRRADATEAEPTAETGRGHHAQGRRGQGQVLRLLLGRLKRNSWANFLLDKKVTKFWLS